MISRAAEIASADGVPLYLVGGVVRDLILGRMSLDVDLVVVGDAPDLARKLASDVGGKIKIHRRFGTATVRWGGISIDIASARSETYSHPGALPAIQPGLIEDDLSRRDFTINAMAVRLDAPYYGELLDPHSGKSDLKKKLIRVLHEGSFIDDATRIFRALRYEQRFDFSLERSTETLLSRDISQLNTISGDRIRHELELILREEYPEKVLERMDEVGVWSIIFPPMDGGSGLTEKFEQARRRVGNTPSLSVYFSLLAYDLAEGNNEHLIEFLRIPKAIAKVMRDTVDLKSNLEPLKREDLSPSAIYRVLHNYSPTAVMAVDIAERNTDVHQCLELYLKRLRYVRTSLDGEALLQMGVPRGAMVGKILGKLREARLDGRVSSRQEEIDLVERWF